MGPQWPWAMGADCEGDMYHLLIKEGAGFAQHELSSGVNHTATQNFVLLLLGHVLLKRQRSIRRRSMSPGRREITFQQDDGDVKTKFGVGAGNVILGVKMVVGFKGKVERAAVGRRLVRMSSGSMQ